MEWNNMMISLLDVSGNWHNSDTADMTIPKACGISNEEAAKQLNDLAEWFQGGISDLAAFNVIIHGKKRFFNMRNIIAVNVTLNENEKKMFLDAAEVFYDE